MPSSANEVRASGFVIFRMICNQIEYLLLQTSYGEHHWTPPKGTYDAVNGYEKFFFSSHSGIQIVMVLIAQRYLKKGIWRSDTIVMSWAGL
jgi:hypothetical protein